MSLRRHRRALRRIEWELVHTDPRLTALFSSFTAEAIGRAMPQAEQIKRTPLRLFRVLRWRPGRPGRVRAGDSPQGEHIELPGVQGDEQAGAG